MVRTKVAILMAVVILSGCLGLQPGGNSPSTTSDRTGCLSDLSVILVEDPELERSNESVFNYSELSSGQKEKFDSALNDSAKISKDAFWLNANLIWHDGNYYQPRIQYC